jgi:uncharacterized RDD family membrane protein YckC
MATATLSPSHEPLDTTVRLVTPERIAFEYPLAGPFRRAFAYLIDLAVLGVLCVLALLGSMILALLLSLVLPLGKSPGSGCS